MNKRELEEAIREEVAEWPGASVEFENATGTGHPKAKLMFGGLIMRRPYSATPSDANAIHIHLGQMRRTLRQMGAERPKPEPSKEDVERRYSKPNQGRELRTIPTGEPAPVKPDIADQLIEAGATTAEAVAQARAKVQESHAVATYDRRASIEALMAAETAERDAKLADMRQRVAAIVDGVYFDLPAEIYHAVPALGSGSICDLIVSPGTFWRGSWLDPNRPELDEEETKAQLIGKAYHIARLEPNRFHQLYARKLDKADFPARGLLSSDEKVKAALKAAGTQQTVSGETAAERAERLIDTGYEGVIWPLEVTRWEETLEGRIPLDASVWDDIATDMDRIRAVDDIAEKLVGGFSEVSIFWTDRHGLRCKARIDYLKADLWDDFKTFDNSKKKVLAQAIADAFRFNRYYVQAVHYRDAIEAIRAQGLGIVGDATDDQRAMIAAIQIRPEELECWYIMQEKGGVPNLLGRRFEFNAVETTRRFEIEAMVDPAQRAAAMAAMSRPTAIHRLARVEIDHAKRDFVLYSQVYRPGKPWAPIEPLGTIGDDDFNSYWLEGR